MQLIFRRTEVLSLACLFLIGTVAAWGRPPAMGMVVNPNVTPVLPRMITPIPSVPLTSDLGKQKIRPLPGLIHGPTHAGLIHGPSHAGLIQGPVRLPHVATGTAVNPAMATGTATVQNPRPTTNRR